MTAAAVAPDAPLAIRSQTVGVIVTATPAPVVRDSSPLTAVALVRMRS